MFKKNVAEKNGNWKGDAVGNGYGLHSWIKRRLPKPEKCPICEKDKKLELSCINHNYKRDLSVWRYLCRSCHSAVDKKVLYILDGDRSKIPCPDCGIIILRPNNYCPSCSRRRRLKWWREYNQKRKDILMGYNKKRWEENKQELKEKNHLSYLAHREERCRKQREYDRKRRDKTISVLEMASDVG